MRNAIAVSICALGFAACSSGTSSVTIWLTDAPGDVSAAVVTIDRIYLQGDAADGGRATLRDESFTTDLLTLSNDVAVLVEDALVPAGVYGQLRFVISGAYIEVEESGGAAVYSTSGYTGVPDGVDVAGQLRTPSWSTSGFKVGMPDGALDLQSEQRILLVDFDVADSFGQQTGSGAWMMRPTLRAQDLSVTGSITVAIDASGADDAVMRGVEAELFGADGASDGTVAFADPDGDGTYEAAFLFLDPAQGPFTIDLASDDDVGLTTDPAMPIQTDLGSGQDVVIELTLEL